MVYIHTGCHKICSYELYQLIGQGLWDNLYHRQKPSFLMYLEILNAFEDFVPLSLALCIYKTILAFVC